MSWTLCKPERKERKIWWHRDLNSRPRGPRSKSRLGLLNYLAPFKLLAIRGDKFEFPKFLKGDYFINLYLKLFFCCCCWLAAWRSSYKRNPPVTQQFWGHNILPTAAFQLFSSMCKKKFTNPPSRPSDFYPLIIGISPLGQRLILRGEILISFI